MKRRVRLTESQLHQVIKESVKRILKEMNEPEDVYAQATAERDSLAEGFEENLNGIICDHDFNLEIINIDPDNVSCDISNSYYNISAHLDINIEEANIGGIMRVPTFKITSVNVWPRIGRGDRLANGEQYQYEINNPKVINILKKEIEEEVDDYLQNEIYDELNGVRIQ